MKLNMSNLYLRAQRQRAYLEAKKNKMENFRDAESGAIHFIAAAAVVGLAISIYVLSATLPGAFDSIFGVNTTAWDSGTAALWAIIPLVVIAVLLLVLLPGGSNDS